MKTLALSFITKNEEENLKRFNYEEVFKQFDEVSVEDTGSTDGTVEFLKQCDIKVSQNSWKNDFSFHRNSAISNVSSDYIFSVEPDVKFGDTVVDRVREIINSTDKKVIIDIVWTNIYENGDRSDFSKLTVFPNDGNVLFANAIHETITESVKQGVYEFVLLDDVELHHYGYFTEELVDKKLERNFSELKKYYKKNPDNLTIGFQLAVSYYDLHQKDFGESIFRKIILTNSKLVDVSFLYLSYIEMNNKNVEKAYDYINKSCSNSRYPTSLNYKGYIEMITGDFTQSVKSYNCALKELKSSKTNYIVPVNREREMIKSYEGLIISLFELKKFRDITFVTKRLSEITEITSPILIPKITKAYIEITDMKNSSIYIEKLKRLEKGGLL